MEAIPQAAVAAPAEVTLLPAAAVLPVAALTPVADLTLAEAVLADLPAEGNLFG